MDEREITRQAAILFSETFEQMSEEQMYYKHFENPNRLQEPIFYIAENGKICAMNAFDQVEMLTDHTEIEAVQSSDSAVSKECRGRGLFFKIQTEAMEKYQELGKGAAFGVPNENSFPIFMKLGWTYVGDLTGYRRLESVSGCIFSLAGLGKKDCPHRKSYKYRGYRIETGLDAAIIRQEDICSINEDIVIGIKRSLAYYHWKIFGHMKENYKIIRVTNAAGLAAMMIVVRKKGGHFYFGDIVEWYVNRDLGKEEQRKLGMLLRRELKGWCDFSTIRFVNPLTEEKTVLQLGYRKKENSEYKLIVKRLQEQTSVRIENLEAWKFRGIDPDTMLNGSGN